MNNLRWNWLFKSDGYALIIALDHISSGFMHGWEYPEKTIELILEGKPDAVLTNFGILKRFAPQFAGQVGTILRLDGGHTYLLDEWPDCSRWEQLYSVEDAVNLGADGVIVNLLLGGRVEVECIRIGARVAGDCLKQGMPCSFEALPVEGVAIKNKLDPGMISFASRMAAELGADFVKTYYSGDAESFKFITTRCPVPVLMAGGPKLDTDRQLLEAVKGMLDGGGRGIVIGRNAWQHRNPPALIRALGCLIYGHTAVEVAMQQLT